MIFVCLMLPAKSPENSVGIREWYVNGKRHREDGPALIWFGNPNDVEFWLKDQKFQDEDAWRAALGG